MTHEFGAAYLDEARRSLRGHKRLAEGAFAQLRDPELLLQIDNEANSVAILIKHLSGNMRSRFTDFLTTDGEKPARNRDQEFIVDPGTSRAELMRWWEAGWEIVFQTIASLGPDDLGNKVYIRGQEHSVLQAINRALAHYCYHVGQIVFLAKHIRSVDWKSLSIPRGQAETFNQQAVSSRRSGR